MSARGWLLLLLFGAAAHPGCTCAINGHVEQAPVFVARAGDDVVNCNCNLSFDEEHCPDGRCFLHLNIPLCLPLNLQHVDLGGQPEDAGADMGPDIYTRSVDRFCREQVTNAVYHTIKVFNGNWCMYKAPFTPDGGVGHSVECFAQPLEGGKPAATGRDDGTCEKLCPRIDCDFDTNCGKNPEIIDNMGNIHFDLCKCSQVTRYACPGDPLSDLPTVQFCRPPKDAPIQ